MHRVKAFGLFWWDFLVGDAPELAVGAVLILALAFALHGAKPASALVVLAAVILLLGVSTWRGRSR